MPTVFKKCSVNAIFCQCTAKPCPHGTILCQNQANNAHKLSNSAKRATCSPHTKPNQAQRMPCFLYIEQCNANIALHCIFIESNRNKQCQEVRACTNKTIHIENPVPVLLFPSDLLSTWNYLIFQAFPYQLIIVLIHRAASKITKQFPQDRE